MGKIKKMILLNKNDYFGLKYFKYKVPQSPSAKI